MHNTTPQTMSQVCRCATSRPFMFKMLASLNNNKKLVSNNMAKILAVFDFDKTIISKNSDAVLEKLIPADILKRPELRLIRPNWTTYMGEIFKLLPQHGFDKEHITKMCQNFEPTDGMIDLLKHLARDGAEIVILSDANSFIISTWLGHNLADVSVDKILTNPASWQGDVLQIKPYQNQAVCNTCSPNLCKGLVLEGLVNDVQYDCVLYTGDGKNDWCPTKKLKSTDFVFARKKHILADLLTTHSVAATVHIWETAHEIKNYLSEHLPQNAAKTK